MAISALAWPVRKHGPGCSGCSKGKHRRVAWVSSLISVSWASDPVQAGRWYLRTYQHHGRVVDDCKQPHIKAEHRPKLLVPSGSHITPFEQACTSHTRARTSIRGEHCCGEAMAAAIQFPSPRSKALSVHEYSWWPARLNRSACCSLQLNVTQQYAPCFVPVACSLLT